LPTEIRSPQTVTRSELAEAVTEATTLARGEAKQIVDEVIDEISNALLNDGVVKLTKFGVFSVRLKPERMGRNPKTGEEVLITPRRIIAFKSAAGLKRTINGRTEDAAD
jgi:integration host factor subunit alpha